MVPPGHTHPPTHGEPRTRLLVTNLECTNPMSDTIPTHPRRLYRAQAAPKPCTRPTATTAVQHALLAEDPIPGDSGARPVRTLHGLLVPHVMVLGTHSRHEGRAPSPRPTGSGPRPRPGPSLGPDTHPETTLHSGTASLPDTVLRSETASRPGTVGHPSGLAPHTGTEIEHVRINHAGFAAVYLPPHVTVHARVQPRTFPPPRSPRPV